MIDAAAKYKHAVVIGGGLLGLEAANGLMLRGMDVTVVHLSPWLMERQLDQTAARHAAEIAGSKRAEVPAAEADGGTDSAGAVGPRRRDAASRTARKSPPTWW